MNSKTSTIKVPKQLRTLALPVDIPFNGPYKACRKGVYSHNNVTTANYFIILPGNLTVNLKHHF